MRYVNVNVLSASDATSSVGASIDSNQLIAASFQVSFTDPTAAGSIQIQASNDLTPLGNLANLFVPTHWSDITGATATVAAGATAIVQIPITSYRFMRVAYTETTPGTGTVNVNLFALSQ